MVVTEERVCECVCVCVCVCVCGRGENACMKPPVFILHIQVYSPMFYVKGDALEYKTQYSFPRGK